MELFLLVRHTHSALRMEMEDSHTQKAHLSTGVHVHKRPHTHIHTLMENCSTDELKHEMPDSRWRGGFHIYWQRRHGDSGLPGHGWFFPRSSNGVWERKREKMHKYTSYWNSFCVYHVKMSIRVNVGGHRLKKKFHFSPLWPWGSESSCEEKRERL